MYVCDLCEGSAHAPAVLACPRVVGSGGFCITASLPNRDVRSRSHTKGQRQPPLCVRVFVALHFGRCVKQHMAQCVV